METVCRVCKEWSSLNRLKRPPGCVTFSCYQCDNALRDREPYRSKKRLSRLLVLPLDLVSTVEDLYFGSELSPQGFPSAKVYEHRDQRGISSEVLQERLLIESRHDPSARIASK